MNILYLLHHDATQTFMDIVLEQRTRHQVTLLDLRETEEYDHIISLISDCDQVICW